jgi:hypothetical protein
MARNQFFKVALLTIVLLSPRPLLALDPVEGSAIGIGITSGNLWYAPIKVTTVLWGIVAGGVSFVGSGGDVEMTRRIWADVARGPYLITPSVARTAIGERPELKKD